MPIFVKLCIETLLRTVRNRNKVLFNINWSIVVIFIFLLTVVFTKVIKQILGTKIRKYSKYLQELQILKAFKEFLFKSN